MSVYHTNIPYVVGPHSKRSTDKIDRLEHISRVYRANERIVQFRFVMFTTNLNFMAFPIIN